MEGPCGSRGLAGARQFAHDPRVRQPGAQEGRFDDAPRHRRVGRLSDRPGSVSRARYQAGYKFDYKFGERLYLSTLVQWDQDRLSGFARRFTQTLSLGYRVLNSSGILWDLEAGPGSQQIRFTDGSGDVQAIGRGTSAFSWKPLPRLEFSDNASVFAGPQNTTVTNTAALTVSVVGPLSTRLGWFWQRESNPPNNREQIDSTLRATVLYDF
nr:DUF481 domain-containing protein [Hankyongella ginsenosidimutans]